MKKLGLIGYVAAGMALCLTSIPSYANQEAQYSNEQLSQLAMHEQWQHLLFIKRGKPEVISPNFYLTSLQGGRKRYVDSLDELKLTLEKRNDKAVFCRYPARYWWLSHQLGFEIDLSVCQGLPDKNQELSLILVSSYLKNPASTFGHVLVKTNKTDQQAVDYGNLLSDSYNYGASIPANENGVMYALKGLFGVYQAGFAKADFFTQDAVYAQNEQRDMWEYVLSLSDYNKALLNYHLHEIAGAKFSYYFIKQNCGYRTGELLELVSDMHTTKRLGGWYAPEFVFDELVAYDKNQPIIQTVNYYPSVQTQVRGYFEQLPRQLQDKVNAFIESESLAVLDDLSQSDQTLVLDVLIAHRNYKLAQKNNTHHQQIKKQLVARRILLPSADTLATLLPPNKPTPTSSNRTTKIGFNWVGDSIAVTGTMFSKDPLDTNTELDRTFEAVKLRIAHDIETDQTAITHLDVLNIEQIENVSQSLVKEPKLSWRLNVGVMPDPFNTNHSMTYAVAGMGVGRYFDNQHRVLGYAFVDGMVHDNKGIVGAKAEIGMRAKLDKQAVQVDHRLYYQQQGVAQSSHLVLRQEIGERHDIRLLADHEYATQDMPSDTHYGIAWNYYW